MGALPAEPTRFFDPAVGYPSELRIVLERVVRDGRESWTITRPIGYHDRHLGDIVVPEPGGTGDTDLTSVPQLMTWLVPKTGLHLPAALVHDGLTPPKAGTYAISPPLPADRPLTQIDADRVFRDAMKDLRTPRLRRWMIWSAVSIPTVATTGKLRAGLAYAGLALIVLLGWAATLDLFDQVAWLPWMNDWLPGGKTPWNRELIAGGLGALVIPPVLAMLWPSKLRSAGVIVGVAIAALLHVTLAIGALTVGYQFLEKRSVLWAPPKRTLKVAGTVAALAMSALTWWLCARA